jgi:hypothetical protein
MIKQQPNNKDARRNRRQRNLVAKGNRHKGGYHTPAKYVRERFDVLDHLGT